MAAIAVLRGKVIKPLLAAGCSGMRRLFGALEIAA
jgi:hypothetical protein